MSFSHISDPTQNRLMPVTPIQGPIYLKNGSVPVVPLYSYPKIQNDTFMHIPVSIQAFSISISMILYTSQFQNIQQNFSILAFN
jgi:hypothetical protein